MKTALRIGFLPLTDCAILIAAQERGFFEKQGLQVELQREVSWANIRDRVAFGELDAAHMLAPMPLAATLGIDGLGIPMQTAVSLGLNGSAITLSNNLMASIHKQFPEYLQSTPLRATGLKALQTQTLKRRLVLGCVYPFSQHYYLLRAWLQDGGFDLATEIDIRIMPPSHMVQALEAGHIDGFCAGEPWNQIAVQTGMGCVAATSYDLIHNGPDKVLGVTNTWAAAHPDTHLALVSAVLEAAIWLDDARNRLLFAETLAKPQYLDVPLLSLCAPLQGYYRYALEEPERYVPDFHVFARYAANVPWQSHGEYFLQCMQAAGQWHVPIEQAREALAPVYRVDLYREAAQSLGLAYPLKDALPAGEYNAPWVLQEASQKIAMGALTQVLK
ncbi:CmpA/NrtA family ABC transporter substrate-binding protein [uncultured Thiothrix sp.]|uniref:CmpA/NrtA family ABC transporter substrate-binding protein n=1 Tax=uncultured Thiothrix sp. TaxID=223185 RepID=UPI0026263133|nr:CmpA/NrtA family ABC transporter substrate-binding protein [uncultured Thiothrix sp.]